MKQVLITKQYYNINHDNKEVEVRAQANRFARFRFANLMAKRVLSLALLALLFGAAIADINFNFGGMQPVLPRLLHSLILIRYVGQV